MGKMEKVLLACFAFFVLFSAVSAQVFFADVNSQDRNQADVNFSRFPEIAEITEKISKLESSIFEMRSQDLTTVRVSDGLIVVSEQFKAEKVKLRTTRIADFSASKSKLTELFGLVELAFEAKDEIGVLERKLEEVRSEIDPVPVEEVLSKAKGEFKDERYEKAIELAVEGQELIVDLQSFDTKARAAAEAATSNLVTTLDNNKVNILIGILVLVVGYLLLSSWLRHYLIWNKIKSLELEREAIKSEIKKAQEDFFVKGSMPERLYHIRIEVFSDMLRDIGRQLAVLMEEERHAKMVDLSFIAKKFKPK